MTQVGDTIWVRNSSKLYRGDSRECWGKTELQRELWALQREGK